MQVKTIKTVLIGLGAVNLGWLKILHAKRERIKKLHAIDFKIVAVADSSGVAVDGEGYDYEKLVDLKIGKGRVSQLKGFLPGIVVENISSHLEADLLIESSSANLKTGEPGLTIARKALEKGWSVVFANKAPLVFAFDELHQLAIRHKGKIAYSATVCGGLPVINVLKRDLKLATLTHFRGVLNATSNFVLRELERGGTLEAAILEAQRLGAAEADPSHDVQGHDTANKLFIIMKSFTDFDGTVHDISVEGIMQLSTDNLITAQRKGCKIKLVAEAIPDPVPMISGDHRMKWKLSVKPTEVAADSFLGNCEGWEMGVELSSDLYEKVYLKNYEADPVGTSAGVLRDAIELVVGN